MSMTDKEAVAFDAMSEVLDLAASNRSFMEQHRTVINKALEAVEAHWDEHEANDALMLADLTGEPSGADMTRALEDAG